MDWQPVVLLVEASPEVATTPLKETLLRKGTLRACVISEMFQRLSPETELAKSITEALEGHMAGGGTWEDFV